MEEFLKPERLRTLLRQERLPAALVDLEAFDKNARALAEIARAKSKTIRVATKSIRVPQLIQRVLEMGYPYRGLMCYSAEEAEFLSGLGFDDLLVTYPTLQDSDLAALYRVHQSGKKISLVVDGKEGVTKLAQEMKCASQPFPVLIELDVSLRPFGGTLHLGARRSPIRTEADVLQMIRTIQGYPQLRVAGVMAYESQIAGLADRNPFKRFLNPIASWVRKVSIRAVLKQRERIAKVFDEHGIPLEIFNGGGTGSIQFSAEEKVLTEITVGSGLLCSHLFDYYSNLSLEPACFFALQVVRSSDRGFVTCQGGGYIASGAAGWDRVPVPYFPQGLKLLPDEGCGEVQTPLRLRRGTEIEIGSPVLFRHTKAGELAERFNEYLLCSGDRIEARARTYRGMGKCFF